MRLAVVTSVACAVLPACRGPRGRTATAVDARTGVAPAAADVTPRPSTSAAAGPTRGANGGEQVPAAAAPTPTPSACRAPLVVAPPYPDSFVDRATAGPAAALPPWSTRAMEGPFASRALAAPGCAELTAAIAAAPFTTVVHCATGDRARGVGPDNLALHRLLVETERGWWVTTLARDHWPHGDVRDERPRIGAVRDLTVADRIGDGGVEVTAIAEEGPPGDAVTRRVVVCGVGTSGTPACADVTVARGGPFHGAGALVYRLSLACDGALDLAGWEGGDRPRLVHGAGRLTFP